MGSKSAEISRTPLSPCLLINVNAINFEKFLLVIGKISGLFFNILTAGEKCSLLNRDKLTQPTQTKFALRFSIFIDHCESS